jgi:hypothetical protein
MNSKLLVLRMTYGLEVGELVSIFEAESRGKDKDEDILTSRVFGIDSSSLTGQSFNKI